MASERAFRVEFDDAEVQRAIKGMGAKRKQLQKVFKALRPPLRVDLKTHAAREASPEGSWPQRAASTMARLDQRASSKTTKRRKGPGRGKAGPINITTTTRKMTDLLGKLPGSVTVRTRGASLVAESPVPWSGVHNEGGAVGRGAVLPQREFVFLSDPFMEKAAAELVNFVMSGWEKAA